MAFIIQSDFRDAEFPDKVEKQVNRLSAFRQVSSEICGCSGFFERDIGAQCVGEGGFMANIEEFDIDGGAEELVYRGGLRVFVPGEDYPSLEESGKLFQNAGVRGAPRSGLFIKICGWDEVVELFCLQNKGWFAVRLLRFRDVQDGEWLFVEFRHAEFNSCREFPGDSRAGEVSEWIAAAFYFGIDDGQGGGRLVSLQFVVVTDNDIDAEFRGVPDFFVIRYAAVDGDDQGAADGGEIVDSLFAESVGFFALGNPEMQFFEAGVFEGFVEERCCSNSVSVRVAENEHFFLFLERHLDAVDSVLHGFEIKRVVQEVCAVFKKVSDLSRRRDLSSLQNGSGDEVDAISLCRGFDAGLVDFRFYPFHEAVISSRISDAGPEPGFPVCRPREVSIFTLDLASSIAGMRDSSSLL